MDELNDASDETPVVKGDYRIGRRLGEGGFGVVHRAVRGDGTEVALKLLRNVDVLDPAWSELRVRFRNEAGMMTALAAHPGIATIYESGTFDDGVEYIVMELLHGGDLVDSRHLYRGQFRRASEVALRAARAVAGAHRLGIIHRDLKPENIMFRTTADRPDDLVVTDFGLAVNWNQVERLTKTGNFFGTYEYASPEQLLDTKHAGEPTDVFAIGVVLFHLVTGSFPMPPFDGDFYRYRRRRSTDTPANLFDTCRKAGLGACPLDLSNLCFRALLRLDQGRTRRAADLADELEDFLRSYHV